MDEKQKTKHEKCSGCKHLEVFHYDGIGSCTICDCTKFIVQLTLENAFGDDV